MVKRKRKKKKTARKAKRSKRKKVTRRKPSVKRGRARAKPKKKAVSRPKAEPKLPAEPIGRVTHYFPKVRAAAVMVERDGIRAADLLYFKGHTTRFKQRVESLQINHQPVPQAGPGDEVGIQVRSRVREHDRVFRLSS